MLHPRSVWSPPSPVAPLPEDVPSGTGDHKHVEAIQQAGEGGLNSLVMGDDRGSLSVSPVLLPQTPAVFADLTRENPEDENQLTRVRHNNPLNYMIPSTDPNPDESQETTQDEIVTPAESFRVDMSPTVEKDGLLPSLVSPSWDPDRVALLDEPKAKAESSEPDEDMLERRSLGSSIIEGDLPPNVKPLDHPHGKRAVGRIQQTPQ